MVSASLAKAIEWLAYLISNAYCKVDSVAHHQIEPPPMGENYAVLVANLTWFCFELTFLMTKIDEYRELKEKF